ncbi:MAG: hypothetical protein JKY08_05410 [Flavobacteriaceae bacterium]|nr:hypothetical protein [Flavobacteriaceae bacterium]
MLLIRHAISACLNEGKNQKELAELLGVDGSRISEGKIGKWKLSPSQRQMVIDNYGYPRRGKGLYIKAEVYNSVSDFIADYDESSKKRFKHRMYELVTRKDYQKMILSYVDKASVEANSDSVLKEADISIIESLLSQPETKIWYDSKKSWSNVKSNLEKRKCDNNFELLLNSVGISSLKKRYPHVDHFQEMIYRISQFKFELMPEFSLNNQADVRSIELKEFVITSDEIIEMNIPCSELSFNDAADILGPRDELYAFEFFSDNGNRFITSKAGINCKPDNWGSFEFKLYLSENMNYHLWIRLCDYAERRDPDAVELSRNIMIKDLCHINYLKEIEIIRKWCDLPYDICESIKINVAKVGGYVPGAEVL